MDGVFTLDQLRSIPIGTIVAERRYTPGKLTISGGIATLAELRSTHGAGHFSGRRTPAEMWRRLEELEAEIREQEAELALSLELSAMGWAASRSSSSVAHGSRAIGRGVTPAPRPGSGIQTALMRCAYLEIESK